MNRYNSDVEYTACVEFADRLLEKLKSVVNYNHKPNDRVLYELPAYKLNEACEALEKEKETAKLWHKDNDSKSVDEVRNCTPHYPPYPDSERERKREVRRIDSHIDGDY